MDGIVYGFQKYGGINTYFNEVLPRLAGREGVTVEVLLPYPCQGQPPGWPVRRARREVFPEQTGLSWKLDHLLLPWANSRLRELRARLRRRCVFHSTYFTRLEGAVPQVASAYDMNHELFPEKYDNDWGHALRRQYREYLARATRIIAISHKTKQDIVRFYGIDPAVIDVVHLAIDTHRFYPDRRPEGVQALARAGVEPPYVLYVGVRNREYKNFDGLLKAFAGSAVRNALTLVVAGPPWKRWEEDLVRDLGLEGRVRLAVYPSADLLRTLYSRAAAFVYPSLHEGFGIPLLEAMACGTPVLASDIEVFREVAGDAVVYFDPHDPAALARTLEGCLDESVRREYTARGARQVSRYSWDRCAEETCSVYRRALA